MKKHAFLFGIFTITAFVFANNTVKTDWPVNNNYIEYLAGIELLSIDRFASPEKKAEKYRKLCELTGIVADSAESFVKSYSLKPDEWQKIQAAVIELLQTIK